MTLDFGVRLIFATLPPVFADYIRLVPLPPDVRVFAFMLAAGFMAALLFGALPALQVTRGGMAMRIQAGATPDASSSRLRAALVVAQITASALLIVTSGVLLRGATRLADTDLAARATSSFRSDVRAPR